MTTEQVYYCQRDGCERHARTAGPPPLGFITVTEDAGRSQSYFCSWDCLLFFAGEKPPAETIPADSVG
jgi:hypothetical protein